ncbi:cyclin-dependent kinase G-2-like isoform X2 [Cornus florida]|uniref:cyclin-dependent kinase G-2-like isoform X2 n=1 Tax=Cornus florida TaxID=4283 RepID=UPI00289CFF59|nr:cyclin-dependent kinase G-2-like isoform X2 [Cornus florida]
MAAGRCDIPRNRDFHCSRKEIHHDRKDYRDLELSRSRGRHGGHKIEYGSYTSRSSLRGRTDGGLRQGRGYVGRMGDRDGGELSCSGRSSDAHSFQSGFGNNDLSKFEDGRLMHLEKKRKFSPIVWDRDGKEVRIVSKNRIVPTSAPLHSPPSLVSSLEKVQNVPSDGDVTMYPVTATQLLCLQISPVKPAVAIGSVGGSQSVADSPNLLHPEQSKNNDLEPGLTEEEEYLKARNISASRWAYDENSPGDICSNNEEDMPSRREVVHHVNSLKTVSARDMSSPESGEFWREGSDGSSEKSSQSGGGHFLGPANGDEFTENDLNDHDFMEVDGKHDEAAGVKDSDSEDDSSSCRIQGHAVPNNRSINMLQGCRSLFEYEKLNKINEGTYGIVYRAKDKKTGDIVALKKVKMGVEGNGGFPLSALREINILSSFQHPSIVNVQEVVMGDLDNVFMVLEYMDHDLKELMQVMKQPFSQSEVKCLMLQLLEGVKHLHDNWVIHRDLKTANLLVNNRGELKICDFGMARRYGSPLRPYTPLVVTLWYRAPEVLLGTKEYSTAIDMWSVGCIMAELLAKEPLFNGKTELDQLDKIFRILGVPNETVWPGFSELPGAKANFVKQQYNLLRKRFPAVSFTGSPVLSDLGLDLLNKLLTYDPEKRITAEAALGHGWFHEVPLPKSREFMPTFPPQHIADRRVKSRDEQPRK